MARTFGTPWRDENRHTKYPFDQAATLATTTGQTLLEGMLLDANLYPVGGSTNLYISQIELDVDNILITLSDDNGVALATAECSLLEPPERIAFQDDFGRPAGVLVVDPLALLGLQGWGPGTFLFNNDATRFCASVCWPTPPQVLEGIELPDGTLLTGEVWLVGADGVVLRWEGASWQEAGTGETEVFDVIRVDYVGNPLFLRQQCQTDSLFETPRFVKKIVFIGPNQTIVTTPDDTGSINIYVGANLADDSALRMTLSNDGLTLLVAGSVNNT